MNIKISSKQMLNVLHVIAWIIFVGVCIDAGGIISNAFYTLVIKPGLAKHFWGYIDLSGLYSYDAGYFLVETLLMSIVTVMKALIFYLIVKVLHDKRFNMDMPFNKVVGRFIFNIAYLALGTGLFSFWGAKYAAWFVEKGIQMPNPENLRMSGPDVWLFMGVTLFVIAHIFKRGIEIQSENELTV